MSRRNVSKLIHFTSTAWFVLSVSFILALALRQAGKSWWVIISLSGYTTPIAFMLMCLYLFAIFRGASRNQKIKTEHPLTSSLYYAVFYDVSPFLGTLAGGLAAIKDSSISHYLLMDAMGCFWATFLVWIIVDPAVGLLEMLSPASCEHRQKRLAEAKVVREKERLAKQCLLAQIKAEERQQWEQWSKILQPYAEKLAALVADGNVTGNEAVNIGVDAWRIGGLGCMRRLHSMVMDMRRQRCPDLVPIDYVSIWWDGIGNWRDYGLEGEYDLVVEEKSVDPREE